MQKKLLTRRALRWTPKLRGVKSTSPKWDVWLPRASHAAQVGLLVLATFGYVYTVRPIYQRDRLEEEMAKMRIERDKETEAFAEQLKTNREVQARITREIEDQNRKLGEAEERLANVSKKLDEQERLAGARYKSLRTVVAQSFAYRASIVCIQRAWQTAELIYKQSQSPEQTPPPPLKPSLEEFTGCVRKELVSYSPTVQDLSKEDQTKLSELVEALPGRVRTRYETLLKSFKQKYPSGTYDFQSPQAVGIFIRSFGDALRWQTALSTALDDLVKEFLAA